VKRFIEKFRNEKIRNPKQPAYEDIPTRPINKDSDLIQQEPSQPPLEPPQLIVGCAQSAGKQRDHNEDALFTLTTTLVNNYNNISFGLYIVADGMGGHQYGEVASSIAIRTMASSIVRKLYTPLLSPKPNPPDESLLEIMQEGVQEAHRAITKQVPGGGTTLTAALILGNQMTIAHVGDSRAYLIDDDSQLEALTRDHSLVNRLVELGQITTDEAAVHPQRNVLYRALGQGEPFDADINSLQTPESGHLLLCSDGLWSVVNETELQRLVKESVSPEEACQRMVEAANAAGGPDNISAILIRLPG
jgi:serine/threonine protein phosphatase PrpC